VQGSTRLCPDLASCPIRLDFPPVFRQNVYVRVISLKPLHEFWARHGDAEKPLRLWYKTALSATWRSLEEVRRTYPHADGISGKGGDTLTVFNVGGNKYRLIARVRYDYQLINVRAVLTHAEYDKGEWKE
jgi:mRNA interferase HigB